MDTLTRIGAASLFASATLFAGSAVSQDVAAFYRGKTVTVAIGSAPGGGYDTYGRLVARHLGKYIPGGPSVIAANIPGAGGNTAANNLYFLAPKDGTQIGALTENSVVDPLFSSYSFKHEPNKFQYLASANNDVYICAARTDSPIKTFGDALTTQIVLGGSTSAATSDFPALLNNVMDTKFKLVLGYAGVREISLAIENKEVAGICGTAYSALVVTNPGWFQNNVVKVIAQLHVNGHPELNKAGVPLAREFAKTAEQKEIMDLFFSQTIFGRPFAVAPEVPADRVAALRKAMFDALHDPDLVAEAKRLKLDLDPVSGEEVQATVAKIYAAPADLVAKTKAAIVPKG